MDNRINVRVVLNGWLLGLAPGPRERVIQVPAGSSVLDLVHVLGFPPEVVEAYRGGKKINHNELLSHGDELVFFADVFGG